MSCVLDGRRGVWWIGYYVLNTDNRRFGVCTLLKDRFLGEGVVAKDSVLLKASSFAIKLLLFLMTYYFSKMDDVSRSFIPRHSTVESVSFWLRRIDYFIFCKLSCLSPSTKSIEPR